MKITKSQRTKINRALENHDKFKDAYFWTPPWNAAARRRMEEENTWEVKFTNAGITYEYTSDVSCSCKNVYYSGAFFVDGVQKTVRCFKGL